MALRTQDELQAVLEKMLTEEGYLATFEALHKVVEGHNCDQYDPTRDIIERQVAGIAYNLRFDADCEETDALVNSLLAEYGIDPDMQIELSWPIDNPNDLYQMPAREFFANNCFTEAEMRLHMESLSKTGEAEGGGGASAEWRVVAIV